MAVSNRTETKKKIRVFYLITGLKVGGAEQLVLSLATNLDPERFEVVVGNFVDGAMVEEFERNGIRVHNFDMKSKLDISILWRLLKVFREERPDILHTHLVHADFLGRLIGRWCEIPVMITTVHMLEDVRRRFPIKQLDRWMAQYNQKIVAVSEEVQNTVVEVEKLDASRFVVIPNAGDAKVPDLEAVKRLRGQLNIPEGAPIVGTISRLEAPRKAHHILLPAMKAVIEKYPDAHCVIVGDGPPRASLEELADQLGIGAQVHFMGTQRNIADWLSFFDVFAFPSLHEGAPIALIEAMSAGVPIITTPVGGIAEYLSDEESALFIPINDIEALAGAIDRVFSDGDLAKRIASQATTVFDKAFNIKNVIKKTEKVYEDCLEKNGKIKLLEVATTLDTGGVTTHIVDLVTRLPSDKFDISLASGSEGHRPAIVDRVNGSHHYQVGLTKAVHPIQDLKATWDLYRLIKRERFDVVHAHMLKAEVVASLAAKLSGVPYMVSTNHGGRGPKGPAWKQTSYDCIQGFAMRYWHDRVIGVSESVSQEVLRKSGMSKDKIETVLNGIDLDNYEVDQPRDVVRAALGLTEDQPLIVMVGRLVEQKSPMTLIEAMRDVAKAWPNVQCLFIGDGPAHQEMQEAIDRFALGEWVRILGHRDDVADILNASDIFVLCTKYEGLSIAVLEAMVMSLPVVGTDVPGMDELIEHGETGLLIPENDPTACADAICSLLESPERLQRMGEQAQLHVRTRHTVDIMVSQTEVVLSQ